MGVEMICVLPHGGITLNPLVDTNKTNSAFETISHKLKEYNIDKILIFDPHESCDNDKINFYLAENYIGKFTTGNGNTVNVSFEKDPEIEPMVLKLGTHRDIVVHKEKTHLLSWGSTIPMSHLKKNLFKQITVAKISNRIKNDRLENITRFIIDELNKTKHKICIILSCDLSHCHSKNNKTFKFNKNSKIYDHTVVELTKESKFASYKYTPTQLVKDARTCGNKNFVFLSKVMSRYAFNENYLSYEVPTYFGMMVSFFNIDNNMKKSNDYCFNFIKDKCFFKGRFPRKQKNKFFANQFLPRWGMFDHKFSKHFCKILYEKIKKEIGHFNFQICGLESGSISMLTAIPIYFREYGVDINSFVVKKEKRTYGLQNIIDGFPNEKDIVILDDIYNSGAAYRKCKDILMAEGYTNILDHRISILCVSPRKENIYLYTFNDFK